MLDQLLFVRSTDRDLVVRGRLLKGAALLMGIASFAGIVLLLATLVVALLIICQLFLFIRPDFERMRKDVVQSPSIHRFFIIITSGDIP